MSIRSAETYCGSHTFHLASRHRFACDQAPIKCTRSVCDSIRSLQIGSRHAAPARLQSALVYPTKQHTRKALSSLVQWSPTRDISRSTGFSAESHTVHATMETIGHSWGTLERAPWAVGSDHKKLIYRTGFTQLVGACGITIRILSAVSIYGR